jgi:hypothetical protein
LVDDTAVVPGLVRADLRLALEHDDVEVRRAPAQLACDGNPDDPGADDGRIAPLRWASCDRHAWRRATSRT